MTQEHKMPKAPLTVEVPIHEREDWYNLTNEELNQLELDAQRGETSASSVLSPSGAAGTPAAG